MKEMKENGKDYRVKNAERSPDYVNKPGPTLDRAKGGNFRKGKQGAKGVTAGAVADALSKHWGRDGGKASGMGKSRGRGFDRIYGDGFEG